MRGNKKMANKFFITKETFEKLKKEYEELQRIRTTKLQKEVPQFLHSEDLDADYLIFREDMSILEAKILEIENILKNAALIVPPPKKERDKIFPGAIVTLKNPKGEKIKFSLVGNLEANPKEGKISVNSPLGKALLGKKVGDEVLFANENQKQHYKIVKIQYHLS